MPRSETRWWATIRSVRSGASVAVGTSRWPTTSSGRSRPPTPASSVASTSRSGPSGSGGSAHVNDEREVEVVGRVVVLRQVDDRVLEAEQHPRVDLQREVQIDRTLTPFFGVEVDLPRLAQASSSRRSDARRARGSRARPRDPSNRRRSLRHQEQPSQPGSVPNARRNAVAASSSAARPSSNSADNPKNAWTCPS